MTVLPFRRAPVAQFLASAGVAVSVGVAVAIAPATASLVTAALVGTVLLVTFASSMPKFFLTVLLGLLVGYAFLGRGLAHVGVPPLYVGEMVLALALAALVVRMLAARLTALHALLIAFMVWGATQTIPYIDQYGLDAFRDAVTWGYAAFAIAVSVVIRREWLRDGARIYGRLLLPFVLWVPIAVALSATVGDRIPPGPGSDIPILALKGGDLGVHLAGAGAFVLLGLHARFARRPHESLFWVLWILGAALIGVITRGGLFAAATAFLALLFAPSMGRFIKPLLIGMLLVVVVALVNPEIEIGLERRVSLAQVIDNVVSVVSDTGSTEAAAQLQGTKSFRLAWWNSIIDYTVHGDYFWTGKGFGINLADSDGFQVTPDHALRAPHNGHVEILARMGVPGLVLWILLNVGWSLMMLRRVITARFRDPFLAKISAWLLVYWAAILVNASFDPYLQGPQGGIWYWTIIGVGISIIAFPPERTQHPAAGHHERQSDAGPPGPGEAER